MPQDRSSLVMSPPQKAAPAPAPAARTDHLTGAQKAAIIVRVLLAEGMQTPVADLPPQMQALLTQTLGSMRLVDRATMAAVVDEFVQTLEQVGVAFPDGVDGALSLLGDVLDEGTTRQLRALSRGSGEDDPWSKLALAEEEDLLALLQAEALLVGAVLLSKLDTDTAARLLMRLPAARARDLALAVSRIEGVTPTAVARIGATLAEQVGARPPRAFATPPGRMMGAILNATPTALRDRLLADLDAADEGFAQGVRQAIFTFRDIPERVAAREVPTVVRAVPAEDLTTLIAANRPEDEAILSFLLANMSKRMAETLRDDAGLLSAPDPDGCDEVANRIAARVRALADAGDITLQPSTA